MSPSNMLCCLCGSDDVRFLLVEKMPPWLGSERIRKLTGEYRAEPYCSQCVRQPLSVGGWIVEIELKQHGVP